MSDLGKSPDSRARALYSKRIKLKSTDFEVIEGLFGGVHEPRASILATCDSRSPLRLLYNALDEIKSPVDLMQCGSRPSV